MKGSRGPRSPLWLARLSREKLGLPAALLFCALFFLAGLFGSLLIFSPSPSQDGRVPRLLLELDDADAERPAMNNGKTGEPTTTLIPFQVLSWKPRALYFPKFATAEQCQTIVKKAKSRLRPSTLALRKGENAENTKGIRTSSGTFLSSSEDSSGVLRQIEEKIARATMIPREHGEAFNVLRYEIGQRYASHYDAFNPAEYGPQKSQRVASFLLYLTDVEEGGETMFPYEDGSNMDIGYDYEKCIGLKVKPRQGDGLLFYSLFLNGTIDATSLHGSCPVVKGEKWVATKWIRDQIDNRQPSCHTGEYIKSLRSTASASACEHITIHHRRVNPNPMRTRVRPMSLLESASLSALTLLPGFQFQLHCNNNRHVQCMLERSIKYHTNLLSFTLNHTRKVAERDETMECWWKRAVVLSIRRVRLGVATRLGIRRTGLRKLRKEVRTCEYNDVHVMWELLRKTDPEIGRRTPALCGGMQRRRWTSLFHWAPCNLCRNF